MMSILPLFTDVISTLTVQVDLQTDQLECKCNFTEIYSEKCKFIVDRNKKECSFFYFQKLNSECTTHMQLVEDSFHKNMDDKHIPCGKVNSTFYAVSHVCTYVLQCTTMYY